MLRTLVRDSFHRYVWQRLPHIARRRLLFELTTRLSPRPSVGATPRLPLIVAGTFHTASGLGASARICHDALKWAGADVYGIDLTDALWQNPDFQGFDFKDGRAVEGAGTLILHVNGPLMSLAMRALGRRLVRGKHVIGYWAWELPDTPADWRFGVPFLHAVWVPSQFTAHAVGSLTGSCPVRVVPHPIAATNLPRSSSGSRDGRFTVLTAFNMASSMARKNPVDTVRAFRRAFGDDPSARLIVKISNADVFPAGMLELERAAGDVPTIEFVSETLTPTQIDELYDCADVLVSLHRSEGFGLTIAEAMLRGIPVVATDWSGSTDFFDARFGIPVRFELVPARDPQGTYDHPAMQWAEPDVNATADALIQLRRDRVAREAMGRAGREHALAAFSLERYIQNVKLQLRSDVRCEW